MKQTRPSKQTNNLNFELIKLKGPELSLVPTVHHSISKQRGRTAVGLAQYTVQPPDGVRVPKVTQLTRLLSWNSQTRQYKAIRRTINRIKILANFI